MKRNSWSGIAAAVLLSLATLAGTVPKAHAQSGVGEPKELYQARKTRIVHRASTDKTGGNGDFVAIEPGRTFTLMDEKGTGVIRRWWVTIAPFNDVRLHKQLIVRCYWDDETEPSVQAPIGDFFGTAFGDYKPYQSTPLELTSGGYNCHFPMPFKRRARITVENRSDRRVDAFYYNIDAEMGVSLPKNDKDMRYFHAEYRRQKPTVRGQYVTLANLTGAGHYVGTYLQMQLLRGRNLGFLEGDEYVWVDGEKDPSIIGTGTEDYFSSGWYFNFGPFSAPRHGLIVKDEPMARIAAYRWHLADAIPFQKSLRFTIEHGAVNDVNADYVSVAYWYQNHPHTALTPLPTNVADLLPTAPTPVERIAGLIEGENLINGAKASDGSVTYQDMAVWEGMWSGLGQLWWQPTKVGATLILHVKQDQARSAELIGYFTRAKDYGDFTVTVNGKQLAQTVRAYRENVVPTGPVSLGKADFRAGDNEITLTIVGKDAKSTGYLIGIDGFLLK